MRSAYFLFCLLALSCFGCVTDPEIEPAYVTVTGFDFTTEPGQGAATSNISEVWAFIDGNFVGAYRLPARFPIQAAGTTEITFRAGIRQNGVSDTPDFYDFYAPVVRTRDFVPGQTTDFGTLPLRYRSNAQFALIEDFEPSTSSRFREPVLGEKSIVAQDEFVRSGRASGRLSLADDCRLVEIASGFSFRDLTARELNVYLEVDVLGDIPGLFGVTGQDANGTVRRFDPGFNPREEWTKIYFDLTSIIVGSELNEYLLLMAAQLPEELTAGDLYIDNIKLVHF